MIKQQIEINSNIYKLAEAFRNFVPFVFSGLGKDPENTRFETFNDIGQVRIDSSTTGFFSFRNEELFYWIFLKITHSDSQGVRQEFETQIKKDNIPILQIYGETFESKVVAGNVTETASLKLLNYEFEEDYIEFAKSFLRKIENKLKVTIYDPVAA